MFVELRDTAQEENKFVHGIFILDFAQNPLNLIRNVDAKGVVENFWLVLFMLSMFRITAFVVFLIYSVPSNSQDELILFDSLIQVNAFPVLHPKTDLVDEIYREKLPEVYRYKRGDGRTEVKYVLGNWEERRNMDVNSSSWYSSISCVALDSSSIIYVPPIHLAFFYARTFRRKSEKYRNLNFFVDHFIKNYGDSSWRTSDYRTKLKLYSGDSLLLSLRFGPLEYRTFKAEGMVSTGRNQLDLLGKFETWNHFNPKFYWYSIEVLDDRGRPYECYSRKIGFRDIRLNKNQLLINNYPIRFKAVILDPNDRFLDGSSDYLHVLKVHNFNSIVLENPGTKGIFNFCDSAGFNVVQMIGDNTFNSLQDLLEFFVCFKDHPSFIAWMDTGLNSKWVAILKRLDKYRPIVKQDGLLYPATKNWHNLDSAARTALKIKFQIFRLYYVPDVSVLRIDRQEPFEGMENIGIKWTIENGDSVKDQGFIDDIQAKQGVNEILVPTKIPEPSEGLTYHFQVVMKEDCFPFRANDVIALAQFRYVVEEDKLVYKVDY